LNADRGLLHLGPFQGQQLLLKNQQPLKTSHFVSSSNPEKKQVAHVEFCILFETYLEFGGFELSRRTIICKLQEVFGDELIVLSTPGIANIIAFHSCASQTSE